jgi:hypothetical protein
MVSTGNVASCCGVAALIGFFLIIIILAVVWRSFSSRKFKTTLQDVARETGCAYSGGGWFSSPKVSGMYRNRNILIDVYVERHSHYSGGRSRETSTTYTRIQVNHTGKFSGEINIYPQTFFSVLGKALGMQDVSVGNPEFDKAFIVKGNDETFLRKILDAEMQRNMLSMKKQVRVLPNVVYILENGTVKDKTLLMNMLNMMVALAERVEKVR